MWEEYINSIVILNEVCCISMEEKDRLEDWPDSLVSPMLAQDIHRVELSR
jgi:hypothetical protein